MTVKQEGIIAKSAAGAVKKDGAKQTLMQVMNSLLDSDGYRKRFDDLLGKRAPQFVSSVVSMVNADANLQKAFLDAPHTVLQAALKAATFDLPIDTQLGYAYILPFNNRKTGRMEAQFILGYKGMNQLALRTGAYKTINVIEVREGELISFNRLTEDIELKFVEDEEERAKLPVIGYVGYFRLINGTEKTIYMSVSQINAHEKRHRKGQYRNPIWNDDFDAMAMKTVFRRLIGKFGIMSIDYQTADAVTLAAAEAMAKGHMDDEDLPDAPIDITGDAEISADEPHEPDAGMPETPDEVLAGQIRMDA